MTYQPHQHSKLLSSKRICAVAEVAGVLGFILFSGWVFRTMKGIISIRALQIELLGQPIIVKAVFFILLPMVIIKVRGEELGEYGIAFDNLSYHLKIGLKSLAIVLLADTAFALVNALGMSYTDWDGALILSLSHLGGLVLVARFLKNNPSSREQAGSSRRVPVFFLIFIALTILSALTLPLGKQVGGFTYALFTTGFGEEILFRGYIQSRLNRAFGKPFYIWGVRWGLGVIIAALLFGLVHCLHRGGTLWWGLWTIFPGLIFGFLREKTGGIVAPTIAHGVPAAIVYVFMGGID